MSETWKAVPGYVGLYEVSDTGQVRSLPRRVWRGRGYELMAGRVLKPGLDHLGRAHVSLSKDKKRRTMRVHSLVAAAFIGPKPEGQECRHLNGDCRNNHLSNLAWGTKTENNRDQVEHLTHRQTQKTTCPIGHVLAEPNLRPSHLRRGQRSCRACGIARSSRYRGDRFKPQADKIYMRLLEGSS